MAFKQETHSFKIFTSNMKQGKTPKLVFMYGEEQFLVNWAVENIVKKYVNAATKSMDYVKLDENATCENIIETCETFSMFSEKRVVWVKDFKLLYSDTAKGYSKDQINMLSDYLERSNDGTILIFSGNEDIKLKAEIPAKLKKTADVYNFCRLDYATFKGFALKRFKAAGVDISPSSVKLLIDVTGYFNRNSEYRLFNFANDIEKIIAHTEGGRVSDRDIESVVCGDMETFVFALMDGIINNHKEVAFQILYNMLSTGGSAFAILSTFANQFEFMLSVKQLREDGVDMAAMMKKLGCGDFRIKKAMPFVNRYSEDKLKSILISLYEVDRNIKTGLLDDRTALELFIAGI